MSARKRKDAPAVYCVRVDDRFIVGFRNVPDGAKVVLASNERAVADCCIAQLGRSHPYEWSGANAAHFIANRIGGSVETVGGPEPPEGWDEP
jgi:hypothetical protein